MQIAAILPSMVEIAHAAAEAIMDIYLSPQAKEREPTAAKVDGSPVTRADLAAHTLITSALRALPEPLPVVSEEDAASHAFRAACGRFWLVDPLDGTREFMAGKDEFTVNIALIEGSSPVAGVVAAPALGMIYYGAPGHGAWREGPDGHRRLTVSRPALHEPLRVIASRSHLDPFTERYLAQLGPHSLLQAGSSLKFCRIAEGSADLYPRFGPTCEWDVAAGHAVLRAAGGQVVALDGRPLAYGKADVTNPPFIATGGDIPAMETNLP